MLAVAELIRALLSIISYVAAPIIVFFIILAGFLYVTARGNAEGIGHARKVLVYAILGGLLILGANLIFDIVVGTVDSFGR